MKKIVLILVILVAMQPICYALEPANEILSLLSIKTGDATPAEVTSMLGQPEKRESNNRTNVWYYTTNNTKLVIYWNNKTSALEKAYFTKLPGTAKNSWNNAFARQLKAGETKLADAVKVLGVPNDMRIKTINQELHYTYQNYMLHLFFHKGTLVNYTFY